MNAQSILLTLEKAASFASFGPDVPKALYLVGDHLVIATQGVRAREYKVICNVTKKQIAEGYTPRELEKIERRIAQTIEKKPKTKNEKPLLGGD